MTIFMDDPNWVPLEERGDDNDASTDDYYDEGIDKSLQQQAIEAQEEATRIQKEYYENLKATNEQANSISQQQLDLAKDSADREREQYQYWEDNFLPFETSMIEQAERGIDAEAVADIAGRNMEKAHDSMDSALDMELKGLGVNPSDKQYDSVRRARVFQRVKDVINAKNNARLRTKDVNDEMKSTVAGMGRGLAASALGAFRQTASTIANAGNSVNTGGQGVANAASIMSGVNTNYAYNNYQQGLQSSQFNRQYEFNKDMADASRSSAIYSTIGTTAGLAASLYFEKLKAAAAESQAENQQQ